MKIKLESQGRLSIPKQLLKEMGLKEGDSLQIDHTDSGILLTPKKNRKKIYADSILVFQNHIGTSRFLTLK